MHETGYFELLEASIRKYPVHGKVGIVGDLNARCGLRSDILEKSFFDKYMHVIGSTDDSKSVLFIFLIDHLSMLSVKLQE